MAKLTELTFILENCDRITVEGSLVGDFVVSDITTSIERIASNSIEEIKTAHTIAIELSKDANVERYQFGQSHIEDFKEMTFDRIVEYGDITAIVFTLYNEFTEESKSYHYYVDWCGDSDYVNDAQSCYISKIGNLYVVINKEHDINQFFDKKLIDDEECMKFKFDGYSINED